MPTNSLVITYTPALPAAPVSLTIKGTWLSNKLPRMRPNTPEIQRSVWGAAGLDGRLFIPHMWTLNWLATPEERDTALNLWQIAHDKRVELTLTDTLQPIREVATVRTRPLVDDTTVTTVGELLVYYTVFNVYPVGDLTLTEEGPDWRIEGVVEETTKRPA